MNLKNKIYFIVMGIVLGFGIYMVYESFDIEEKYDYIYSENITEEFDNTKIIFVSDIHCTWYFGEKRIKKIAERINKINPDIIILGGDYLYKDSKYIELCFRGISGLKAKYGVFAVLGNHDQNENKEKIINKIKENKFNLLENSSVWIWEKNSRIKIGGVEDYLYGNPNIKEIVNDVKKEDFVICVSHNPDYAEKLEDNNKVDLIISGHTHGGQFTLFRKIFPFINSENGEKYLGGVVKNRKNIVIVSRGIGTIVLPMRFCSKPQINGIILKTGR